MTVRIALDAGHGINTPGKRTPDGEREWSFNNVVLLAAQAKLQTYKGVELLRTDDPSGKTDVPLITRTNKANAWGADVLVSIHHNANAGKWGAHGGVETFTQRGSSKAAKDIAEAVHSGIVTAMRLRDRGLKTSNLHMTRATKMPAILTEGGFMDSTTDIGAMRDNAKLRAQGVAIAEGLAAYFGLKSVGEVVQAAESTSKPVVKPASSKPAPSVKAPAKKAPVAPKPAVKVSTTPKASLIVDGYWGPATTRALQSYFGMKYVDGVISRPSPMVRELQRLLGVTADGYLGPITYRAMQKRFGTYADGVISRPSPVVRELQRRLNNGKL